MCTSGVEYKCISNFFFFSLSSHYAYNKIIIMGLHTISMHELTKLTWKLITTMGSNHYLS